MAEPLHSNVRYEQLIDQLTGTLQPVRPLWPVWAKLIAIVLLEAALLSAFAVLIGIDRAVRGRLSAGLIFGSALLFTAGVGAGWLSFRSSIPGRGPRPIEVALWMVFALAAATIASGATPIPSSESCTAGCFVTELIALSFPPWLAMLWWAREAAPLNPRFTGALAGTAASLFAFATLVILQPQGRSDWVAWGVIPALLIIGLSGLVTGEILRDRTRWAEKRSHYARLGENFDADRERVISQDEPRKSLIAAFRWPFVAIPALAIALLVLILLPARYRMVNHAGTVPDFDIAIAAYQASNHFQPNIPSASVDMIASAYIDHGIPPYVWDFGREGYRLIGGRIGSTPEGNPAAFTLYRRGENSSIICMIVQTHRLHPPPGMYTEQHHYRFYDYRGYRIGVCYYGVYAAVMVSRIPMADFVRQVAAVVPQG